jgi:hypothetical protein
MDRKKETEREREREREKEIRTYTFRRLDRVSHMNVCKFLIEP